MTQFYDSASQRFPAGAEYVCLYGDGDYAAPVSVARRYPHVRYITVLGDYATCGCADYEAGNAVFSRPGMLRAWVQGRQRMGCLARVYADRSNTAEALDLVGGYPNLRWWISTLDDNPHWTAEELAADLRDNWHADIAAADLWGVQYSGGLSAAFDTSLLLAPSW